MPFQKSQISLLGHISCLEKLKPQWNRQHLVSTVGEGNGTPLQYSCLENPMDRGAWWAAVHEVVKTRTRLSDFTFTFHFHALEKEMATNCSILAWRIPGTGEPGGLPSMGSHRVGHDWSDLAAAVSTVKTQGGRFPFFLCFTYFKFNNLVVNCKIGYSDWAQI